MASSKVAHIGKITRSQVIINVMFSESMLQYALAHSTGRQEEQAIICLHSR